MPLPRKNYLVPKAEGRKLLYKLAVNEWAQNEWLEVLIPIAGRSFFRKGIKFF